MLSGIVIAAVLGLWRAGLLQFLELHIYDHLLRSPSRVADAPPRVVIVGATDEDLDHPEYGWPLTDSALAKLLMALAAEKPRAIGLDIYRNLPVPASGEQLPELENAFKQLANVVAIYSVDARTPPPPSLQGRPEQIGFNDLPVGSRTEAIVRRGLLFMDHGEDVVPSFAFQLASYYLAADGIHPEPDPVVPEHLRFGKTTIRPFERNDGAFVKADAKGYQFLMDYKGPRPFPRYSIQDVATGHFPSDAMRDRVVLIGVTAKTVKDYVNSALQSDQYGVEVHAHSLDQLLRAALDGDRPLQSWKEWQEGCWIAGWALVGAFLGYYFRSPVYFTLVLGGCGLLLWISFYLAFGADWWIPVAAPAAALFPCAGLVTSFMSYQEKAQRALLMQIFSRHVSKDIAESVWEQRDLFLEGGRPRSQRLTATVLFSDLQGFTTISEAMDPAALVEWLNEGFERMVRVVAKHNGVVNKFIGDAVMAIFGVPIARISRAEMSRDACNAVRCALAMAHELAELNRRWQTRHLPSVYMRIGIFTGPLIAGSVGSSERMEYTVIGDTVNTASRLESFDKRIAPPDSLELGCRILIGEPTLELLDDQFETRLIGSLEVKGKSEKVTIYQVLGEKSSGRIDPSKNAAELKLARLESIST